MRLLICAGGTGGGVYPALVVQEALRAGFENGRYPGRLTTLWVGGIGGMEVELVDRAGIPFEAIPAAGVHGVGLRALPGNLARLARGTAQSRRILARFRPGVLFFTGGYVAVPMAVAGLRVPTALYVPDIEPGLALKTLARFADRIAVTTETSQAYFPNHRGVTVSGYPTRRSLKAWDRSSALEHFGFSERLSVLLVFGGSKGARSINRALLAALPDLLREMQIVHLSGSLDWEEVSAAQERLDPELAGRYWTQPYLHEMGAALAAADLVVSRAGASTLGEYPLFGLPAVLVPYPYAWRYQRVNAGYLEERGAAVILPDEDLREGLQPLIRDLIRDHERRNRMAEAMRSLAHPRAAESIADILFDLAESAGRRRK